VLIEMQHRRGGLGAAIRACGGLYRSVPMNEPDDAVSARMRVKVELSGDMAEEVWINLQAAFTRQEF